MTKTKQTNKKMLKCVSCAMFCRVSIKSERVISICSIVSISSHGIHTGGYAPFNKKKEKEKKRLIIKQPTPVSINQNTATHLASDFYMYMTIKTRTRTKQNINNNKQQRRELISAQRTSHINTTTNIQIVVADNVTTA